MTKKIVVLGATGAAGQNVVEALVGHPWFKITGLAASPRSEGKTYRNAVEGAVFFEKTPISKAEKHRNFQVTLCIHFVTTNANFAYIESE